MFIVNELKRITLTMMIGVNGSNQILDLHLSCIALHFQMQRSQYTPTRLCIAEKIICALSSRASNVNHTYCAAFLHSVQYRQH